MNSATRCMALSAAACALASLFAADAAGRQTDRRGAGNPAEVERLERERRDREMHRADLSEREFLLRNMKPDPPAERPTPRLPTAQIREDFVRLQLLNNALAKAAAQGDGLDLKFVSKSAAEIKRLAVRLRENLALPEAASAAEEKEAKAAPPPPPAPLGPALATLDRMILKFADDLASKGVYLVDARSSANARRDLGAIIELSGRVKRASDELGKSGHRPR